MDEKDKLPQPWSPDKTLSRLSHDASSSFLLLSSELAVSRTESEIFCLQMAKEGGRFEIAAKAKIPEEDPAMAMTAEIFPASGKDKDTDDYDGLAVLTAHRSTLIRLHRTRRLDFVASFQARHSAPISHLCLSTRSGLVYSTASGSDFTVRVWDLNAQSCLRVARGLRARSECLQCFNVAAKDESDDQEEGGGTEFFAVGSAEGQLAVGSHNSANMTIYR